MNKTVQSKLLLFLLVFQVIIDCFNSVTITPFLHSGMYSEVYEKPDSLKIYTIKINGNPVDPANFSIYTWDMIHQPLQAFQEQQLTNDFSFDKKAIKKGLKKIRLEGLYNLTTDNLTNDSNLIQNFPGWYKKYLNNILKYPANKVQVDISYYSYINSTYILLKREEWINV